MVPYLGMHPTEYLGVKESVSLGRRAFDVGLTTDFDLHSRDAIERAQGGEGERRKIRVRSYQ
jgi:hypothetical protein